MRFPGHHGTAHRRRTMSHSGRVPPRILGLLYGNLEPPPRDHRCSKPWPRSSPGRWPARLLGGQFSTGRAVRPGRRPRRVRVYHVARHSDCPGEQNAKLVGHSLGRGRVHDVNPTQPDVVSESVSTGRASLKPNPGRFTPPASSTSPAPTWTTPLRSSTNSTNPTTSYAPGSATHRRESPSAETAAPGVTARRPEAAAATRTRS